MFTFLNYAESVVSKFSGKTQLNTLITFDRVIVLTSNLVHVLLMSKDIC